MIWWIPLIGAAIGALAYEDDPWTGALIGAGIGMTGGAAAGAAGLGGTAAGASGAGAYAAAVPGLTSAATGSQAAMLAAQTGAFGSAGLSSTAMAGAGASGLGLIPAATYAATVPGLTSSGAGSQAAMLAAQTGGFGLDGLAMTQAAGAGASGPSWFTTAKPWLDAGASMVQQSGLLNPRPQQGPMHQPLPQYQGSDIGNQISSQGGDMLQANAMRREENKRRREMQNPFAFGRF